MPSSACKTCARSEEHTSELQSHDNLVCRLLLEKKTAVRLRRSSARVEAEPAPGAPPSAPDLRLAASSPFVAAAGFDVFFVMGRRVPGSIELPDSHHTP